MHPPYRDCSAFSLPFWTKWGVVLKNNVQELREKIGLTQKELGKKVGVSRQAINAIETEKAATSIWLAYDPAKYFGSTIEEFLILKGVQENEDKSNTKIRLYP